MLLPSLHDDPKMRLAVPVTSKELSEPKPKGFIMQLLRLLLPSEWFESARLLPYTNEGSRPGERVVVTGQLLLAEWESATGLDGRPSHCLTPRSALVAAARLIDESWVASAPDKETVTAEVAATVVPPPLPGGCRQRHGGLHSRLR